MAGIEKNPLGGVFPASTAIIQETQERIPNSYVQSCSECCFEKGPDGGPNVLGQLQRAMMTREIKNQFGTHTWLDCAHCPVPLYTDGLPAKTGDGRGIYWKGTDRQVTQGELLKLEEDGDCLELYIDIR